MPLPELTLLTFSTNQHLVFSINQHMRFFTIVTNIEEWGVNAKSEATSCGYEITDFQGKAEEIVKNL